MFNLTELHDHIDNENIVSDMARVAREAIIERERKDSEFYKDFIDLMEETGQIESLKLFMSIAFIDAFYFAMRISNISDASELEAVIYAFKYQKETGEFLSTKDALIKMNE